MNNIFSVSKRLQPKELFKVPFRIKKYPGVVEELRTKGVTVNVDKEGIYACAIFNNSKDFNLFKDKLESFA